MVLVKEPHCNTRSVNDLIQSHVPTAEIESEHAGELSYLLPREKSSHFEQLFTELEMKQKELGVGSFGVSVTTMEEVFLKVGEQYDVADTRGASYGSTGSQQRKVNSSDSDTEDAVDGRLTNIPNDFRSDKIRLNTGFRLAFQQFRAMLVKRLLYSKRYKTAIITQLLLPIVFTLIGLILSKTEPSPNNSQPLTLTTAQYDDNYAGFYITDMSKQGGAMDESLAGYYSSQFIGTVTAAQNVTREPSLTHYLHGQWNKSGFDFNFKYLVAASFESDSSGDVTATGWFNNQAFHAIEVALTSIDNAIMGYYSDGNHTINVTNYPLPRTVVQETDDLNV